MATSSACWWNGLKTYESEQTRSLKETGKRKRKARDPVLAVLGVKWCHLTSMEVEVRGFPAFFGA